MKRLVSSIVFIVLLGVVFFALLSRQHRPAPGLSQATQVPAPTTAAPMAVPESAQRPVAAETSSEIAPAPTNTLFRTAADWWNEPVAEEAFARFHDWAERYRLADSDGKLALESEGILLAQARRDALKTLIVSDPQRALELTVPLAVREAMPPSIVAQLEERVSDRGRLAVLGALAEPGREDEVTPIFRKASLGSREFKAYVYGRRLGEPTRDNIPLNGIALDELVALSENPLRILEAEEAQRARSLTSDPLCSVSGLPSTTLNQQVVAEVAGEPVFLCRPNHAIQMNDQLTAAESGPPGPAEQGPEPSAWTEGQKALIVIRVDFPDLVGAPLADATGVNLISNLNVFYSEMSYGRAGFYTNGAGSDLTPTFRMPQPAAYYGTNDFYDQLRADARSAAAAAGYVLANYSRDVICMGSVPGWGWSGLGYVGAAGSWLRNSFSTGVAGHELGHNWGLNHANYWDTSGQTVTGPGTSVEYGDSFDTMGSAAAGNNHFNARYKNYLNWLTASEIVTATTNGTYRVYAHDNPNSPGVRGLRIVKNSSTNYWVEFRQKFTSNKWLMSGAGLRWAQNSNQKSQLLDTTPGSTDGKNDACIVIGRTFSDRTTGIHITPIGKGGTSPESLDVVVNLGLYPGNQNPVVNVSPSATSAGTGVTLSFTATASDPDGDALAYYWEFGDGNFGTNGPIASKSWASAGDYVVRCLVSDMKGGLAQKSLVVTIGSPTTFRISGQISTTNGPVQGVRAYVSTTRMAYTDSDGTYTITGLPAGSYTVSASLESYSFTPSFANPVTVGPSASNIDFVATTINLAAPNITTQPLGQTVNQGSNATFSVAATGTAPLRYQWRFNGANISGATLSSYTRSNVQAADAGNYSVVVTNTVGTATSANAVLAINAPPNITTPPQSQTVLAGTNATFNVTATGSSPLSYQWRLNNTNIAGATSSSYTRANVQLADAGSYRVIITNSAGSVTSAPATLTVNFSLEASATYGGTVIKNPDQATYAANTVVTLTAQSISVYPFTNWSGDASGTNNPLTVTMNANKTIIANFASLVPDLIVDNPAAAFTGTWSTDTTATDKYATNYRVASSTSGGAATATATFTPSIATAGRYDVYAWFPTITKGAASVPFLISSSSGAETVNVSQVNPSGGWQLLIAGKMFSQGTNGFVQIANNVGQNGKNVAADAVRWVFSEDQMGSPPMITSQPTNQTIMAGQNASFSAAVAGTGPLARQWRFNGAPLAGATNDTLMIPNAQPANAGPYTLVVTNSAGSSTSSVAMLAVQMAPGISTQPQSQRILEGTSVSFNVAATGTQPLRYQWSFNSVPLPGQTNSALSLNPVQSANGGNYNVTITNAVGSITSAPALLTVSVRPRLVYTGVLPNGSRQFHLIGTSGDRYTMQFSTNLLNWTDGATISNVTGSAPFTDTASTNYPNRFYRCRIN